MSFSCNNVVVANYLIRYLIVLLLVSYFIEGVSLAVVLALGKDDSIVAFFELNSFTGLL